jgi:hypothetical protein
MILAMSICDVLDGKYISSYELAIFGCHGAMIVQDLTVSDVGMVSDIPIEPADSACRTSS